MARQSYTADQKRHALELVAAHGLAEATRRSGVPKGTLGNWANAAGIQTFAAKTEHATEARRLTWEARRDAVAADMGEAIVDAVRLVKQGLREGIHAAEASMSTADLKNYATVAAIFTDKAQLLTGAATTRVATVDALDRVARVRDELAARRRSA